jgi:PA14 domain-containing protein
MTLILPLREKERGMKRMHMGYTVTSLVVTALVMIVFGAADAGTPPVNVDVFSGFTFDGGGAPYSGLVGSFQSADIKFATTTGFNWHPFGLASFGADMTGFLHVPTDGTFTFTLTSDDGSLLFIDGSLVVDNGGPHGPVTVSGSAVLTEGTHSFEVQFFECCGGPSGVDLLLPAGVTFGFAGSPDKANCHGKSVSDLAHQFGGIAAAASALGFDSVQDLQDAILAFCDP